MENRGLRTRILVGTATHKGNRLAFQGNREVRLLKKKTVEAQGKGKGPTGRKKRTR